MTDKDLRAQEVADFSEQRRPDAYLSLSKKIFPRIQRLRRHLHQYPELAFEEIDTAKVIAAELDSLDIKVKRGIGKTGVVGLLKGKRDGRTVALRADMDALPLVEQTGLPFTSRISGRMHACGHDAHMAMLVGAANILSKCKSEIDGTVKFLFQPSEEKNPGGAPLMIRDGALSDVDAIFGQHITNDLPTGKFGFKSGPMMASADEIFITVKGKGGHGAKPHETVDPIPIAATIVSSLQAVISRMRNPLDPSVLTIGSIHGGTAPNIIPDEVKLSCTLRTMNERWRKEAHQLVRRTATEIARASGGSCTVEVSHGYPVLVNHEIETRQVHEAAKKLFGKKACVSCPPVMGAEDFGYFLQKVPGSFWWIGSGNKRTGATESIHSSKFKIDEQSLIYGSALLAFLAIEYLAGKDS